MEIEFINITSFVSVSVEAEHFYARVTSKEAVFSGFDKNFSVDAICNTVTDRRLTYIPSREEALAIAKKDNQIGCKTAIIIDTVESLLEDGTSRFPSIEAIIKTAREKFPNAYLVFAYEGNRSRFLEMPKEIEKKTPCVAKLIRPLDNPDTDNNG